MADARRQTTTRGSASTADTASGPAAAGLFTSLTTPSGHARTPRASRAVVAAASSLPRPRLPTTTALSPASTAAASTARTRTTAATPRPSAGPPPTSQLVRTPGNLRAQKRHARDAPWRPSLIGGNSDAAHKLAERRELVRGPVNAALEELLMVGRDEGGEDNGEWAVNDDARNAVQAFQGASESRTACARPR